MEKTNIITETVKQYIAAKYGNDIKSFDMALVTDYDTPDNIPCQSEELVVVEWGNNVATWKFIERNYLDDEDVTDFCNELKEYLKDDPTPRAFTVTVKIGSGINESETTYDNQITINFHAKVE